MLRLLQKKHSEKNLLQKNLQKILQMHLVLLQL
jgi:hypothetical protein